MSCYGCSRRYGLFCKEYGCPNCGYSYCAKCLKRPVAVPKQADKVLNVCLICYDKLSKLQATEKVIDCDALPGTLVTQPAPMSSRGGNSAQVGADALFDDVPVAAELAEVLKPIPTATANTDDNKDEGDGHVKHSNIENADINENLDCVISKRLKDLKTVETTDDEIRGRLANLSGMPHQKNYDKKELLLSTDERSDQEKTNDLLEQFLGESQIDKHVNTERTDAVSYIEQRLRALRDAPIDCPTDKSAQLYSPDTNTPSDNEIDGNDENDETALKKIMKQYLEEVKLPEAAKSELEAELESSMPTPPKGTTNVDTEELPWCSICNEDAIFRCHDCDGALFCAECYRECHDDEEYRAHKKENYCAPPKFKENHF